MPAQGHGMSGHEGVTWCRHRGVEGWARVYLKAVHGREQVTCEQPFGRLLRVVREQARVIQRGTRQETSAGQGGRDTQLARASPVGGHESG